MSAEPPRPAWQNELVAAARELMERRPGDAGEWGAAAVRLADGEIVTSQSPPFMNSGVGLCHETGGILRAWDRGMAVSATVCVYRDSTMVAPVVLTPCGVCQERLRLWGVDVQVGVSADNAAGWEFVSLGLLQPHYWASRFEADEQGNR